MITESSNVYLNSFKRKIDLKPCHDRPVGHSWYGWRAGLYTCFSLSRRYFSRVVLNAVSRTDVRYSRHYPGEWPFIDRARSFPIKATLSCCSEDALSPRDRCATTVTTRYAWNRSKFVKRFFFFYFAFVRNIIAIHLCQ